MSHFPPALHKTDIIYDILLPSRERVYQSIVSTTMIRDMSGHSTVTWKVLKGHTDLYRYWVGRPAV